MAGRLPMLNTIVLGVVVPMLVCSAVLILAWWLRDRGCLIRATALGLGYLSCQLIVDGWPAFPPHETWQGLFALVVGAMMIGGIDAVGRRPLILRLIGAAVLAGTIGWLIVLPNQEHLWVHRTTLAASLVLWLFSMQSITSRSRGASVSLPLCVALVGVSLVLVLSGNAKLAQLAGGAAACLGGATLVAWWRAEAGLGCESIAVAGVLTIGLAYSGYSLSFSGVPVWAYLVAVAAPLAVWVGALPRSRKLGGWKVVTLTTLITVLISGIAVVGAFIAWRADLANDPYF